MLFKKIRSVYDLKNKKILLSDYFDFYIFPTLFKEKQVYTYNGFTDENIYDLVYSSNTIIFIIDELMGRYFVKKACDLLEIFQNELPM